MILASKQKKELIEGLNEKTSPFRDSKSRTLFKNTANLSLRGNTYDATHMDKFLTTTYCNTSPYKSKSATED